MANVEIIRTPRAIVCLFISLLFTIRKSCVKLLKVHSLSTSLSVFTDQIRSLLYKGINNRLKVLKRCCFGLRNINNFKNRALLFWHLTDSLA
ncbi:MAG: transposase [Crocosphaera sp.]|nr:transposase [Crocosphaera sp.]